MKRKPEINYRKGQLIILSGLIAIAAMIFVITGSELLSRQGVTIENDEIILRFRTRSSLSYSCIASVEKPSLDDERWQPAENGSCRFPLEDADYTYYLKNSSGNIIELGNNSNIYIAELHADEDVIYLPKNKTIPSPVTYSVKGNINDSAIILEYDDRVIVYENGTVTGIENGTTQLKLSIGTDSVNTKIVVTDLIVERSEAYNRDKKYVSSRKFSEEENDLLDEILRSSVRSAGYRTRAGAVEAARFLTLDFAYRINYFFENGRKSVNGIDGEGRYYHEGLYLSESRKEQIGKSSSYGPSVWGAPLYSTQTKKISENGLNCSGFVSWALVNGGYDPGDVGAVKLGVKDFQDVGKAIRTTKEAVKKMKVGDLLHSNETGGHIAMLIGIDGDDYYIAESLWYKPTGCVVSKMNSAGIVRRFDHIVDMNDFYEEDGNLSDLWY